MSSYNARLQIPGRTRLPISVTVDVNSESLSLITDETTIGSWALDEVAVDTRSDGFHIVIDGEEAILKVSDARQFAADLKLPGHTTTPAPKRDQDQRQDNPTGNGSSINERIGGHGQEDQLIEVRAQINDLKEAVKDPAIPPSVFFNNWLLLLKTINQRHGKGAIQSPMFFRLNTELLDIMPVPEMAEATVAI